MKGCYSTAGSFLVFAQYMLCATRVGVPPSHFQKAKVHCPRRLRVGASDLVLPQGELTADLPCGLRESCAFDVVPQFHCAPDGYITSSTLHEQFNCFVKFASPINDLRGQATHWSARRSKNICYPCAIGSLCTCPFASQEAFRTQDISTVDNIGYEHVRYCSNHHDAR